MRSSRLQEVEAAETFSVADPAPSPAPPRQRATESSLLMLGRVFSDRSMEIISIVFTFLIAGSAFALSWVTLPTPTPTHLVGLGIYYIFVLAFELARKRQ